MDRKEFLNTLRNELRFLNEEEMEKEVLYYINKIDSSKQEDKEVIKSFGSMNSIVKEVCKRHGINNALIKKNDKNSFQNFYKDLVELSTVLKNCDSKKKMKIILDILLLIVITCVLKIPFIFIRDLGDRGVETFFNSNVNALSIWGLCIEIIYVIIALLFFIKTFRKWFKTLEKE